MSSGVRITHNTATYTTASTMVSTTQMASADHQLMCPPTGRISAPSSATTGRLISQTTTPEASAATMALAYVLVISRPPRLPSNLRRNIINVSGNASNPPSVTEQAMPSTQCSGGSTIMPMIMNIEVNPYCITADRKG